MKNKNKNDWPDLSSSMQNMLLRCRREGIFFATSVPQRRTALALIRRQLAKDLLINRPSVQSYITLILTSAGHRLMKNH